MATGPPTAERDRAQRIPTYNLIVHLPGALGERDRPSIARFRTIQRADALEEPAQAVAFARLLSGIGEALVDVSLIVLVA